jgi:hypothetical protein
VQGELLMKRMLVAAVVAVTPLRAQTLMSVATDSTAARDILVAQFEPSYITILGGLGNIPKLLFEGSIAPHFTIRSDLESRFALVLTPKIVVRMFRESDLVPNSSLPVRTPSYRPRVVAYYAPNKEVRKRQTFFFGSYNHHSNGQEDDPYDGTTINLKSGNFSTNFWEVGTIRTRIDPGAFPTLTVSAERHFSQEEVEREYYGQWRANVGASLPVQQDEAARKYIVVTVQGSWLMDAAGIPARPIKGRERATVTSTIAWKPSWLEDMLIFFRGYAGRDYYNNYFFNGPLTVVQVGVMGSGGRFSFSSTGAKSGAR